MATDRDWQPLDREIEEMLDANPGLEEELDEVERLQFAATAANATTVAGITDLRPIASDHLADGHAAWALGSRASGPAGAGPTAV